MRFVFNFQWDVRLFGICSNAQRTKETKEPGEVGWKKLLYLRQGGACLLTEVTSGKEGWERMCGRRTAQVWLVGCGWNEQRKLGERHGRVRTQTTGKAQRTAALV